MYPAVSLVIRLIPAFQLDAVAILTAGVAGDVAGPGGIMWVTGVGLPRGATREAPRGVAPTSHPIPPVATRRITMAGLADLSSVLHKALHDTEHNLDQVIEILTIDTTDNMTNPVDVGTHTMTTIGSATLDQIIGVVRVSHDMEVGTDIQTANANVDIVVSETLTIVGVGAPVEIGVEFRSSATTNGIFTLTGGLRVADRNCG